MHRELLSQSPLLVYPILAQVLFIVVFVTTTVRALSQPKREIDRAAALPLAED
jgi:hypothetical protein